MNIFQWLYNFLISPIQLFAFPVGLGSAILLTSTLGGDQLHQSARQDRAREVSDIFLEWQAGLSPEERACCDNAVKNIIINFRNIGELHARELLVHLLLYLKTQQDKQKRHPPILYISA